MSHICGVSKKFGESYQKTNKTEDTNKLTLLAFKIIAILNNTRLAMFIKLLETVSKGLGRQSKNVWQLFCDRFLKRPLLTVSRSFMNVANHVLWGMAIILKANKVNLFVSSVLFVLWYHSPNILDTLRIWSKARNFNVVYIYISYPVAQLCVNILLATKVTLITDGI
jgi:hypothetical protein